MFWTRRQLTAENTGTDVVGLPNANQIARIAADFFPNQESCLKTALVDAETAEWIQKETKTVKELRQILSNVNNSSYAAVLLRKIKDKARELAQKHIADYSKDDPINRASLVVYPEKKYILTYQPKPQDEVELKWFWKNVIDFNFQNVIAAILPMEKEEISAHSLEYCSKDNYPLKINDEWTIDLAEEKIFAKSESIENCEIVKRTFVASSNQESKTIYHYHYQDWKNKKGAPDSNLLSKLLIQLANQGPRESPLTIHCACGRGRSGNVVIADIFRQRILAQLKNSYLEDATLNIAEILLQGRLMRDGFVETAEQITSAFETALIGL